MGKSTKGEGGDFVLEQTPKAGEVPAATLDELVRLKEEARVAAKDFATAIEAQAKHYRVKKAALRAYVSAIHQDKVHELVKVTSDLQLMLG